MVLVADNKFISLPLRPILTKTGVPDIIWGFAAEGIFVSPNSMVVPNFQEGTYYDVIYRGRTDARNSPGC